MTIRVRYSESLLFLLTLILTLTQTLALWRVSAQWTFGIAGRYPHNNIRMCERHRYRQ